MLDFSIHIYTEDSFGGTVRNHCKLMVIRKRGGFELHQNARTPNAYDAEIVYLGGQHRKEMSGGRGEDEVE
jgi:hypothetical protein